MRFSQQKLASSILLFEDALWLLVSLYTRKRFRLRSGKFTKFELCIKRSLLGAAWATTDELLRRPKVVVPTQSLQ